MAEFNCRGCSLAFHQTRPDRAWCSKRCYGRGENWAARTVSHCKNCHQPLPEDADVRRRFCDDACRSADHMRRARLDGRYQQWDRDRKPKPRKATRSAVCVVCGTTMLTKRDVRRYCSNRCGAKASYELRKQTPEFWAAHREAVKRRRARKKTTVCEKFTSAEIFERDSYRCHICRKKCNRNVVTPHPLAPTMDHLIPLAHHGDHTRANVATACFQCNSVKGDRGGGEQLAVI